MGYKGGSRCSGLRCVSPSAPPEFMHRKRRGMKDMARKSMGGLSLQKGPTARIRNLPLPLRRPFGDMADRVRILLGLELQPRN